MGSYKVTIFYLSEFTIEKIKYIRFTKLSTPIIVAIESVIIVRGFESHQSRGFRRVCDHGEDR